MPTIVEALVTTLTLDASEYIANAQRQRTAMKALSADERQLVADFTKYNTELDRQARESKRQTDIIERERQKLHKEHLNEQDKEAKAAEASTKTQIGELKKLALQATALMGIFTAGRGIKDFVMSLASGDAATGRLAKNIGMSVEELSRWQNAAQQFGGSAQGVNHMFEAWSDDLNSFSLTGESTVLPIFNRLRVTVMDSNNHMRQFSDIAKDIASSPVFMAMTRPQQATELKRLNIDPGLANAIMDGRSALDKTLGSQPVISKEDAENAAKFEANLNALLTTSTSLGRVIFNDLAPSLNQLLQTFEQMLKDNGPEITKAIGDGLITIADILKNINWHEVSGYIHSFATETEHVTTALGGWTRITEVLFGLWAGSKALGLIRTITGLGSLLGMPGLSALLGGAAGAEAGVGGLGLIAGLIGTAASVVTSPLTAGAVVALTPTAANKHEDEALAQGNDSHPIVAVGDSIAHGAQLRNHYLGSPHDGDSPDKVLAQISKLTRDDVRDRGVVLSSGISNDVSKIDVVEKELQALKALGALDIRLLGTGTRADVAPMNEKLAALAAKYGVRFMGPLQNVSGDQIHPTAEGYAGLGRIPQTDAQREEYRRLHQETPSVSLYDRVLNAAGRGKGAVPPETLAAYKPLFDLIGRAEGTDGHGGYNGSFANGKYTQGEADVTTMTLDQVEALQTRMLEKQRADPNHRGYYSSAIGRYQFMHDTLLDMRRNYQIDGSEKFTPEMQDRLAFLRMKMSGGDDPDKLSHIWASLPAHRGDAESALHQRVGVGFDDLQSALTAVHGDPRYTGVRGIGPQASAGGDTNIDQIIINTQAADANGIARDMRTAIQRAQMTRQANTGLV